MRKAVLKAAATTQLSAPVRQGFLMVLLLIVGVVIGTMAIKLLLPPVQGRVSNTDYALLVAAGYQRDHDIVAARKRLSALGQPAEVVEAARQAVIKDSKVPLTAQDQLRDLAGALQANGNSAANQERTDTSQPPSNSRSSTSGLLIPIIVFLIALVAGAFAAVRLLGIPLPGFSTKGDNQVAESEGPRFRSSAVPAQGSQSRFQRPAQSSSNSSESASRINGFKPIVEKQHSFAPARAAAGSLRGRLAFQSTYEIGDDPYDEIHPIVDRDTGVLLGACGLSASKWLAPEGSGKFYAFTAWLHDYVSKQELRSVGLVSRWATEQGRDLIDDWLQSGAVDDIVESDEGVATRLETGTLAANVTVTEAIYGTGSPAQSHFAKLSVRFEIFVKSGVGVAE